MGSGRTFESRGESEGTGVLVLSCLGEGRTGRRGLLGTILLSHCLTAVLRSEQQLTKLEDNLASGMFPVMHLVKGRLILELRLSVPGEDK